VQDARRSEVKTFITGGTGFIGTHLVRRMAQTDHEMVCLVRKTSDVSTLEKVGATLVTGDVTDKDSLLMGMQGCEAVLHLANIYTFWEPDRRVYSEINVKGTRNVMEAVLETGVSKVVHVSTGIIYGKPADMPFTEESPVGPVRFSDYAETKYQGDLIAWDLHKTRGLPLVVVYPSGVLGPGDLKASGRYVQDLVYRRMPATVFDDTDLTWVHVQDVAEAIVRALEKEGNIGERYLVGGEHLSFREFNQMVSDISGVPLPRFRLPDSVVTLNAALLTALADLIKKPPMLGMSRDQVRTMREGFVFDGSKAERELGFTYTPVRTALEGAIASYRA
jgi:dihydroflavonol-4-reductase